MIYPSSKRFRTFSITLFLLGAVTATVAYSMTRVRVQEVKAFTMNSKRTVTHKGESPRLSSTEVRYQKSNGSWKQVITYLNPDGSVFRVDTTLGWMGRGVFHVDKTNKSLLFISSMPATTAIPVHDMRADPGFLRDDSFMGFKTQVIRFRDDDGSSYTDVYYATALQNFPIKTVTMTDDGVSVDEMVKIEMGEPSNEEFGSLPDWKVDYRIFREKIQSMEEAGRHEAANEMRKELERRLQPSPR